LTFEQILGDLVNDLEHFRLLELLYNHRQTDVGERKSQISKRFLRRKYLTE
jgi:hypothetical protein